MRAKTNPTQQTQQGKNICKHQLQNRACVKDIPLAQAFVPNENGQEELLLASSGIMARVLISWRVGIDIVEPTLVAVQVEDRSL